MLARAYIDDTADGKREKYVIAAALIGAEESWRVLRREWNKALRQPPAIRWFHSKEWRSLTGEFFQFRDDNKWPHPTGGEAANAKRDLLKRVIERSDVKIMSVAVLVPDYEQVRNAHPDAAKLFQDDPFEWALQSCLLESARFVQKSGDGHCITFVSDDNDKAERYSALYVDFKKKNPIIAQMMRGLTHLDDKKWPGLQAADLTAHVINGTFAKWDGIPHKPGEPLPQLAPNLYRVAYMNVDYLCAVLEANIGLDLRSTLGIRPGHKKVDSLPQPASTARS